MTGHVVYFLDMAKKKRQPEKLPLVKYLLAFCPI